MTEIIVNSGDLILVEDVGIYLRAARTDPEHGSQPSVTINTEKAPAKDVASNGQPILMVSLNDATLYDNEGRGA